MIVIEAAEGVPLAIFRDVGPGQYAVTDVRDPNFEAALQYFGIPYQVQIFRERINADETADGKILTPDGAQKPLIIGG